MRKVLTGVAAGAVALAGTALTLDALFPPPLARLGDLSVTVADRGGQPPAGLHQPGRRVAAAG
ncbi:hypothetical protein ACIU1J_02435 [Azospirillum doebereinerae]|uniref:hypothetical protein n=1 Tax=Azospirillum doebereinerae TaxID=92933 RepID=UPI00384D8698